MLVTQKMKISHLEEKKEQKKMGAKRNASNVRVKKHASNDKKNQWKRNNNNFGVLLSLQEFIIPSSATDSSPPKPVLEITAQIIDYDEPKYCSCNEVSYGDMIACNHKTCPIEWFHYPCVGIRKKPEGNWYCPQCTLARKQ